MSRLIDADEAIDYVNALITVHRYYHPRSITENFPISEVIARINEVPTVDAVPVVRCKNCEYGEIEDPEFPDQYFCHAHGCDWNEGDHFCSNGKEKVKERR